jgi:hypothetical protein
VKIANDFVISAEAEIQAFPNWLILKQKMLPEMP